MMNIIPTNRPPINEINQGPLNPSATGESQGIRLVQSLHSVEKAAEAFYRLPQSRQAKDLFNEIALQSLPEDFRNAELSNEGEKAKQLLGIIASDIQPQDLETFKEVCRLLLEVNGPEAKEKHRYKRECIIASKLSPLLAKYGKPSLRQHVKHYIQHCREAWRHHHNNQESGVKDSEIFKLDLLACQQVLESQIQRITEPDQSWTLMTQAAGFFQQACEAITKTLRYHDAERPAEQAEVQPQNDNRPQPAEPEGKDSAEGKDYGFNINIEGSKAVAYGGCDAATHHVGRSPWDFGIELLRTPLDENVKVKLIEVFLAGQRHKETSGILSKIDSVTVSGDTADAGLPPVVASGLRQNESFNTHQPRNPKLPNTVSGIPLEPSDIPEERLESSGQSASGASAVAGSVAAGERQRTLSAGQASTSSGLNREMASLPASNEGIPSSQYSDLHQAPFAPYLGYSAEQRSDSAVKTAAINQHETTLLDRTNETPDKIQELAESIQRMGAWSGNAGDFAPNLITCLYPQIELKITRQNSNGSFLDEQIFHKENTQPTQRVELILKNEHYTPIVDGTQREVEGNGDCFYRSFLYVIKRKNPEEDEIRALRKATADYIRANPQDIASFITDEVIKDIRVENQRNERADAVAGLSRDMSGGHDSIVIESTPAVTAGRQEQVSERGQTVFTGKKKRPLSADIPDAQLLRRTAGNSTGGQGSLRASLPGAAELSSVPSGSAENSADATQKSVDRSDRPGSLAKPPFARVSGDAVGVNSGQGELNQKLMELAKKPASRFEELEARSPEAGPAAPLEFQTILRSKRPLSAGIADTQRPNPAGNSTGGQGSLRASLPGAAELSSVPSGSAENSADATQKSVDRSDRPGSLAKPPFARVSGDAVGVNSGQGELNQKLMELAKKPASRFEELEARSPEAGPAAPLEFQTILRSKRPLSAGIADTQRPNPAGNSTGGQGSLRASLPGAAELSSVPSGSAENSADDTQKSVDRSDRPGSLAKPPFARVSGDAVAVNSGREEVNQKLMELAKKPASRFEELEARSPEAGPAAPLEFQTILRSKRPLSAGIADTQRPNPAGNSTGGQGSLRASLPGAAELSSVPSGSAENSADDTQKSVDRSDRPGSLAKPPFAKVSGDAVAVNSGREEVNQKLMELAKKPASRFEELEARSSEAGPDELLEFQEVLRRKFWFSADTEAGQPPQTHSRLNDSTDGEDSALGSLSGSGDVVSPVSDGAADKRVHTTWRTVDLFDRPGSVAKSHFSRLHTDEDRAKFEREELEQKFVAFSERPAERFEELEARSAVANSAEPLEFQKRLKSLRSL